MIRLRTHVEVNNAVYVCSMSVRPYLREQKQNQRESLRSLLSCVDRNRRAMKIEPFCDDLKLNDDRVLINILTRGRVDVYIHTQTVSCFCKMADNVWGLIGGSHPNIQPDDPT